jgi:2-polyprenyl-3-methyl-5-hydroxy-6-metoxy-1,4-benzoquinol methylase
LVSILGHHEVLFGQNFVFDSLLQAQAAPKGKVQLIDCLECGLIQNRIFSSEILVYDTIYQNEQQLSDVFKEHLSDVILLIKAELTNLHFRLTEVGCGIGDFAHELRDAGYTNVYGFDAAYEVGDSSISKELFRPGLTIESSPLLVLRHVLEHVESPYEFLVNLAAANNFQGKIYIEVPDFDWIQEEEAFSVFFIISIYAYF